MYSFIQVIRAIRGVFSPDSGLLPATYEYNRARQEALRKYRRTGHRYYNVWDPNGRRLVPITFEGYRGDGDSFQHLRHRGVFSPMSRRELKDGSFYFTPSRNGAREMEDDVRKQKIDLLRRRYFAR